METLLQTITRLLSGELSVMTVKLVGLEADKTALLKRKDEIKQELSYIDVRLTSVNADIDALKLLIVDAKREMKKNG